MRAVLLILTLCLIKSYSFAQFEIVPEQLGFSSTPKKLQRTKSNDYIIISNSGFFGIHNRIKLIKANGEADVFFNYLPNYQYFTIIGDVIELNDSNFILSQHTWNCSDFFGTKRLVHFDQNWNYVRQRESRHIDSFFGVLWNNDFIVATDDIYSELLAERIRYSSLIREWFTIPFSAAYGVLDAVVWDSKDTLMIATDEGLRYFANQLAFSEASPTYLFDQVEYLDGEVLLAKKEDSLFLHSIIENEQGEFALDSHYRLMLDTLAQWGFIDEEIIDLSVFDNEITVLTNQQHIYHFNQDLELLHDFPLPEEHNYQLATTAPDGIVLAGTTRFGSTGATRGNDATFLKKYDFEGNSIPTNRDVSLVSMNLMEAPIVTESSGDFYVELRNLKIWIQNLGDSVLQEVHLNINFPPIDPDCEHFHQFFSRKYSALNLPPGTTKELLWEEIDLFYYEDPIAITELCVWTSMPDQRLDRNNSNDLQCQDILLLTDLQDLKEQQYSLQIYPNPSKGRSTVALALPNHVEGSLRIFNSLGQRIQTFSDLKGVSTLELEAYPPGLYYVTLFLDGRIVQTKKLLCF